MKFLNNESGMASLVIAFSIVAVSSLVILQMSVAFQNNQSQHRTARLKNNAHIHLLNIAQRVKRSYDLADLDPNCTRFGSSLQVKRLPGHTAADPKVVCLQDTQKVCTTNPNLMGSNVPICASLAPEKMNWQVDANYPGGHTQTFANHGRSATTTERPSLTVKTTRISVPDRTNSMWKDCNGSTCLRVALCPPGMGNCADNEVQGSQTIMLGNN